MKKLICDDCIGRGYNIGLIGQHFPCKKCKGKGEVNTEIGETIKIIKRHFKGIEKAIEELEK